MLGARQAPVRGRPRTRRQGRRRARSGRRREALVAWRQAALEPGRARRSGYHSSGLPGPKGNLETFIGSPTPRGRRRRARQDARGARAVARGGRAVREITVFTHRRPDETRAALGAARRARREAGVTLRFDAEETRKHGLRRAAGPRARRPDGRRRAVRRARRRRHDPARAAALREHRGAGVRDQLRRRSASWRRSSRRTSRTASAVRCAGDFELLRLPAIVLDTPRRRGIA